MINLKKVFKELIDDNTNIWIITKGGIVIFSRVLSSFLEDQMFGMLMTALNIFAQEVTSKSLANFELADQRFYLKEQDRILFIVSCAKLEKKKKILRELDYIITKFFKKYPNFSEIWDGNVNKFADFEKTLKIKDEQSSKNLNLNFSTYF